MPTPLLANHSSLQRARSAFAILLALSVVLLLAGVPLARHVAERSSAAAGGTAPAKTFEELDRDRDGWIARSEALELPGLALVFERADANGDGRLTKVEYAQALALRQGSR